MNHASENPRHEGCFRARRNGWNVKVFPEPGWSIADRIEFRHFEGTRTRCDFPKSSDLFGP